MGELKTTCAFCGNVPTELPHWCLLEKREREEAQFLEWAAERQRAEDADAKLRQSMAALHAAHARYTEAMGRIRDMQAQLDAQSKK